MDCFGYMIVVAMVLPGVISPLVRFLYKPSSTYHVHKRRTIQDVQCNDELRTMVCIYNQDNVPTILRVLEASNATRESPIIVYVLHLVELLGRATPLLIAHKPREKIFDKPSESDHIINSFKIYEKQNHGLAIVQPFTAITPVVTAHNDVCTLALEKRTSLIIIPFHKHWNIDGTTQSSKWRNTNKKILDKAPCSVGVLIDRGGFCNATSVVSSFSCYSVGVIFLGGADDREAVCYVLRMAEHPNVHVTVHHLNPVNSVISNVTEKRVDGDAINGYRLYSRSNLRCQYKEDIIKDGVEIVSAIRTMQDDSYDLVLVGRRHGNYSGLLSAFTDWSEYPELGFFGDLFASSDFKGKVAVLVIQQHSFGSMDVIVSGADELQ